MLQLSPVALSFPSRGMRKCLRKCWFSLYCAIKILQVKHYSIILRDECSPLSTKAWKALQHWSCWYDFLDGCHACREHFVTIPLWWTPIGLAIQFEYSELAVYWEQNKLMGNKRKRNAHRELLILKRRMKQLAVFGLVVYSTSEQLFVLWNPIF